MSPGLRGSLAQVVGTNEQDRALRSYLSGRGAIDSVYCVGLQVTDVHRRHRGLHSTLPRYCLPLASRFSNSKVRWGLMIPSASSPCVSCPYQRLFCAMLPSMAFNMVIGNKRSSYGQDRKWHEKSHLS